ncbi:hypothetical protein [Aggregatilinea lenta]|uniref:hypothetical protein n=1 Tax=Aggregatilinea lenta TaxID=913108 RepID=UPI000E5A93CF|nr:hypothetical protein [Aggregatilinea lenta]
MNAHLARVSTWESIAPAMPDSLEELGNGQYLAKWWKPVPMQEVQVLLQIEGITILRGPYEPRNLPGGVAVRFAIGHDVLGEDASHIGEDETFPVEARRRATRSLQRTGS